MMDHGVGLQKPKGWSCNCSQVTLPASTLNCNNACTLCCLLLQAGENITFTWSIIGVAAEQKCTHGTDAAVSCKSPFTVAAKNVDAGAVMFTVAITDVCGNEKEVEYSYTAQGVTALTKVDDIPTTTDGGGAPVKKNGAAATAAAGMLTLGMGVLAALL